MKPISIENEWWIHRKKERSRTELAKTLSTRGAMKICMFLGAGEAKQMSIQENYSWKSTA